MNKKRILNLLSMLLLILVANFVGGCSKEEENPNEQKIRYLTKVFLDGKIFQEYVYSSGEKLPARVNYFDTAGIITNYTTMEYSNGLLTEQHNYRNTGESSGGYSVFTYNNSRLLELFCTYTHDTSTLFSTQTQYVYNSNNELALCNHINKRGVVWYKEKFENTGERSRKTEYIDAEGILKATVFSEFDNMRNPFVEIRPTGNGQQGNNLVNSTSPDLDENGALIMHFGSSTVTIWLSHREYEYNEDNYPVKEIRTDLAYPYKVKVYTYEYKK